MTILELFPGQKTEIEVISESPLIHIIHPGGEQSTTAVSKTPAVIGYVSFEPISFTLNYHSIHPIYLKHPDKKFY